MEWGESPRRRAHWGRPRGHGCLMREEVLGSTLHTIYLAKIGGKGVAEVSHYWGLIYLYLLFIQKESKVGLTCHLQEN